VDLTDPRLFSRSIAQASRDFGTPPTSRQKVCRSRRGHTSGSRETSLCWAGPYLGRAHGGSEAPLAKNMSPSAGCTSRRFRGRHKLEDEERCCKMVGPYALGVTSAYGSEKARLPRPPLVRRKAGNAAGGACVAPPHADGIGSDRRTCGHSARRRPDPLSRRVITCMNPMHRLSL
jgi:hypothetical protein